MAKIKLKTRRSAAKRFKLTASGKVKCGHAFTGHIKTKKTPKRKRNLRQGAIIESVDMPRVKRMILS